MKNRTILLLLIFYTTIEAFSQESFYSQETRTISVENEYGEIKCEILTKWDSRTANTNAEYYWYDKGMIFVTQGAYAGYLVDGQFIQFDKNSKNIIEKGIIRSGKKKGKWIKWSDNGKIIEISKWKNGFRNGKTVIFDELQFLKEIRKYKKNKLNGKQYVFNGKQKTHTKYKNGILIKEKIVNKKDKSACFKGKEKVTQKEEENIKDKGSFKEKLKFPKIRKGKQKSTKQNTVSRNNDSR